MLTYEEKENIARGKERKIERQTENEIKDRKGKGRERERETEKTEKEIIEKRGMRVTSTEKEIVERKREKWHYKPVLFNNSSMSFLKKL